jgi:ABC-2 type transport system permease protein
MAARALAAERQEGGIAAFLRACRTTAWLEYRNLRYYPSNLVLAAVQELTLVALWYFTARFLSAGANSHVRQYGGDYLAYVLVGVLVNQVGLAALGSPFTTISEAFWDKRLETYRLSIHGIWANVLGRLGWQVLFSTVMQGGALVILLLLGALTVQVGPQLALAVLAYLLFVAANAGIGIAGASLFFLLEVKSGADPITWSYKYLVMLITGLYIPLSILPVWVRAAGAVLPQTPAFAIERAVLLTGAGLESRLVVTSLAVLVIVTGVVVVWGYLMLRTALRRAEQRGGIGVVV